MFIVIFLEEDVEYKHVQSVKQVVMAMLIVRRMKLRLLFSLLLVLKVGVDVIDAEPW